MFYDQEMVMGAEAEQDLASVCGVLNASYARLVAITAQALVDESWAIAGVRSPEHWLSLRAGLSRFHSFDPPAENGHHQQHTTREPQADETAAGSTAANETDTGETGAGQSEADCAGSAQTAAAGAGPRAGDPPTWNGFALDPDPASAPAELSMSHDHWGRFTLRYTAPADLGALVEAALSEAKDALIAAGQPEVSWADALTEVAARSMSAVTSLNRRDAYRTYVHLDTEGAWLTGRPRLPTHLADKLTCDGVMQPVWHTQGAPVNVGRAQRIVPTRTRRLVQDRDRGCRFPGCNTTGHLECHHLIHWADGGPTNTTNLACLCTYHHDTHHHGDFTITGNANNPTGLTFTTRNGNPIHPGPTFTTPTTRSLPGSPGSTGSEGSPEAPNPPGLEDSQGIAGPPRGTASSPSPPLPTYRGPSGEILNLRWCTFHEPRERAPARYPTRAKVQPLSHPINCTRPQRLPTSANMS